MVEAPGYLPYVNNDILVIFEAKLNLKTTFYEVICDK
jgi:hypothetical protein